MELNRKNILDLATLIIYFVFNKFLALVREVILVGIFSKSIFYSKYLFLRTIADVFCVFSSPNALQGNIIPPLIAESKKGKIISYKLILNDSIKVSLLFLLISLGVSNYFISQDKIMMDSFFLYFFLSFIICSTVSLVFFSSVGNTLIQSTGNFKKFAFFGFNNSFIETILTLPLSVLEAFGVALSRFLGIIYLCITSWRHIFSLKNDKSKPIYSPRLKIKEFDFSILLFNNLWLISLHISRLISGFGSHFDILFFTCATLIMNSIMTIFMQSISSLLIKNFTDNPKFKEIWRLLILSVFINIIAYLTIKFWGYEITTIIFERGEFEKSFTVKTFNVLQKISIAFSFQFIANVLTQPALIDSSKPQILLRRITLFLSFFCCGCLIFYAKSNPVDSVKLAILSLNILSLLNLLSAVLGLIIFKLPQIK